ncbi:MAG: PilW family protein [Methylobacillus sp.]|jgi:type IV pilus assembly protein PilW|nr:PilW family protein [Methylobacillus sp.]
MKKNIHKKNRRQFGVTLIELMVSVAISLFLIAVIGGAYITARNVFASTAAASGMDENVRVAFSMIGTSIRQASFNGCAGVTGTVKGDTRGANYYGSNWYQDFTKPVQSNSAPGLNNLPTGKIGDMLTLIGVDPTREASVVSDEDGIIQTGTHDFNEGDVLLAMTTDCSLNSYFVMTNDGSNTTIPHKSSGTNDSHNCNADLGINCAEGGSSTPYGHLARGALILPVVANAYFIADSASANKGKSLWRRTYGVKGNSGKAVWSGDGQDEELINGVENMALEFGIDSDGDRSIDGYATLGDVTDWNKVLAVRIHLLIATLPDAGTRSIRSTNYRPIDPDHPIFTPPTDNRIYREYTSIFALRNRIL